MTFRLRANSDQRRRRVLLEETRTEEGMPAPPRPARRAKRYADDALRDAQLRVTDFLCGRWRQVIAIATVFTLLDVGLAILAWLESQWSARWPDIPLTSIAARYGDSLAGFFLSLQLALATGTSALLLGVRRRRLDDLRGTYQVWIWGTALLATLFLLVALDIESLLVFGLRRIPKFPALEFAQAYLWVPLAAIYTPWIIRMLVEMRRSRTAQVALVSAGLMIVASEAIRLTTLSSEIARPLSLGMALLAATLLCLSLQSYGRQVKMEARGNWDESGRRKKKRRKTKTTTLDDEDLRDDLSDLGARTGRRFDAPQTTRARPRRRAS